MALFGSSSLDRTGLPDTPASVSPTMHPSSMTAQLAKLLEEKEHELQTIGSLGQRILGQRVELEERINGVLAYGQRKGARTPEPGRDPETSKRLRELLDTVHAWREENSGALVLFDHHDHPIDLRASPKPLQMAVSPLASPRRLHHRDLRPQLSLDSLIAPGPSASGSSRRVKNTAQREDDAKFVHDIGTSLLAEVRRLQGLLRERDETIQGIMAEKDDIHESLETNRHQQQSSAEKFKEENWSLEVRVQDLGAQLQASQHTVTRAEYEVKTALKQLAETQEILESQKSETERVSTALEQIRAKHEIDVAQMRKEAATLTRDKSDLQASLDTLKWGTAKRERYIKHRYGGSIDSVKPPMEVSTPNMKEGDADPFAGAASQKKRGTPAFLIPGISFGHDLDSSPDVSPSKPVFGQTLNDRSNELEALEQVLSEARDEIARLKAIIQNGQDLRTEGKSDLRTSLVEEIRDTDIRKPRMPFGADTQRLNAWAGHGRLTSDTFLSYTGLLDLQFEIAV
ncbi:hypothetical protein FRB97_003821 [Tulasnella sp. 331]|nr:hypothetical protein FRB97_003821 [Tulasnella sp. 331]KAG8884610.1 hypothetical protein FRB98_002324 [Tulasnella sp. 332]